MPAKTGRRETSISGKARFLQYRHYLVSSIQR